MSALQTGVSRLFGALLGPTPRQGPLSALQPPTLQAEAYEMEVETSFPYSPGEQSLSLLIAVWPHNGGDDGGGGGEPWLIEMLLNTAPMLLSRL